MADLHTNMFHIGLALASVFSSVSGEIVTVNFGSTAVLICPLSEELATTFWRGPPNNTLYNAPGSTVIESNKPNANRLEINATNAGLLIHNVILEDEGIYNCTVVSNGSATLQLKVTNVPPSSIVIENTQTLDNHTILHGSESAMLSLVCSVHGAKPEPNITWSRLETNETLNSTLSVEQYENGTYAVSALVTLMANRDLDGAVFICTIEHSTLQTPVENEVEIYLDLKPLMEEREGSAITTEGTKTTVSCQVFGARPAANLSLYLAGEKKSGFDENVVVKDETSNTYTTTAVFHRVMDRKDDGKMITCSVDHLALDSSFNKTWINVVHYPTSATISGVNVTSNEQSLSVECLAISGNPDNFTFSQWQHRWKSESNILRELDSTNIENNKATLQLENITFQDSGYYKCFVSNGIGTVYVPDYVAEDEIYIFIKDFPHVVDGHTQYLSNIDETVEITLDVYTNGETLHVSIARATDTIETTAVWTIKDNIPNTVGVPVYNQKLLLPGFKIAADFEVQAEKNYGDYKVVIRNEIGSTSHYFSVLPRGVATTGGPAVKEEQTNVVAIVVGVVVPIVVIFVVAVIIFVCSKQRQKQRPGLPTTVGKKYVPTSNESGNLYDNIKDYIKAEGGGYINPTGEGKSTDKDDGYLEPQSPTPSKGFKAEYIEYTKGDEKIVIKKIEGVGRDQLDFSGSMKMPSLTMSAAHQHADPEEDKNNDEANPMDQRCISIEEMPEMTDGYIGMSGNLGDQTTSTPDIEEVD